MAKKKQNPDSPDAVPPALPTQEPPFPAQPGTPPGVSPQPLVHPKEPWYAGWAENLKWWFQQGWKTTPAFRYIQFLVSLCAGLTIVLFIFRLPPLTALIGTIV